MANPPLNTELLDRAIIFAVKAHAGTERRGKGFPYIIHPLEAMQIVSTLTSDQELLAAAVLHDTVEDCDVNPETILNEFGTRIAALVEEETTPSIKNVSEKESWRTRKQQTLNTLSKASQDAKIVAIGDKLSNMRAISQDYRVIGDKLWQRFHAPEGKKDIEWYYRSIADALSSLSGTPPYEEYLLLIKEVFE